MRTIGQVLNSTPSYGRVETAELPNVGGIGIELELESNRSFRDVRGWERTSDGSLRNGVEYVFAGPQAGRQALETIMAMGEELQARPADPSFRCSTHIHMDVRDLGFDELDRLVALYTLYEGVMFGHCAPYRRYSNFCPPYFINDQQVRNFNQQFRLSANPASKLSLLRTHWNKYSSLNLKVTGEIGSVEFRGSHALTTSEELLGLAQRMLHLKRYVKENPDEDCMSFITRAHQRGFREVFLQGISPQYAHDAEIQDLCYSNAVFLASSEWRYNEAAEQDRPQTSWEDALQRATVSTASRPRQAWSRINAATFELYNIDPNSLEPHASDAAYKSLASIVRVWAALRTLRGIQPPTFNALLEEGRTLSHLIGDYGATTVTTIFNQAGIELTNALFRSINSGQV